MKRCGGQQQAAVVGHKKFAQSGDVVPVADLLTKDLAQILKHDEQGSATPSILFADCGYQRVGNLGVFFFGFYLREQLRPQRFVFEDLLQYPAHADQEIGERQRPVRFLWKPDDHDTRAERLVRLNGVFNAREQVSLADPARTDEQQVAFRLPVHRTTQGFDGVVEQVFARNAGLAQAIRVGYAGSVQADVRIEGWLRHSISSTTISGRRWRSRRTPPRPRRCRSRSPDRALAG